MIESGIYQLLIGMPGTRTIKIGNLGLTRFPAGLYIYTGSAKNSLRQRLSRHFSGDRTKFWHIDYLLQFGELAAYHIEPFRPGLECRLNKLTKEMHPASEYVPGFGSSDCKCFSHLIYIPGSENISSRRVYN